MKRIFVLLLVLAMTLSLACCGKNEEPVGGLPSDGSDVSQEMDGPSSAGSGESDETQDSAFDTAWAKNEFEALLPQLPFTGWTSEQKDATTYKMQVIGLNTSAATNPPDSGEPDGKDKQTLLDYLDTLPSYGFTVEETGTGYRWLVTDPAGNTMEFKCGDGGCFVTIEKAN